MGWITHQEWSGLSPAIYSHCLPANDQHIYHYQQTLIETTLVFLYPALPQGLYAVIILTQELYTTISYYWLVAIAS